MKYFSFSPKVCPRGNCNNIFEKFHCAIGWTMRMILKSPVSFTLTGSPLDGCKGSNWRLNFRERKNCTHEFWKICDTLTPFWKIHDTLTPRFESTTKALPYFPLLIKMIYLNNYFRLHVCLSFCVWVGACVTL